MISFSFEALCGNSISYSITRTCSLDTKSSRIFRLSELINAVVFRGIVRWVYTERLRRFTISLFVSSTHCRNKVSRSFFYTMRSLRREEKSRNFFRSTPRVFL
jgi:hypothetical protein